MRVFVDPAMPRPRIAAAPRVQAPGLGIVVGAHLCLGWALWHSAQTLPPRRAEPLSVAITWSPAGLPRPPSTPQAIPAQPRAAAAGRVPSRDAAITLPTTEVAPVEGLPGIQGAEASSPAPAPGAATLDLSLPRSASAPWRARSPAAGLRVGSGPARSVEDHIRAVTSGSGDWTEERLDADRVVLRSGSRCVMLHRSRAEGLDAFNSSTMSMPWAARPCDR